MVRGIDKRVDKRVEIHMRVTDAVIALSVMLRDAGLSFTDYRSETGSFYFTVGDVQIRVSNHSGHALKRNEFSVRTDAQTKSKDRIYSANDIRALVARIVEKTSGEAKCSKRKNHTEVSECRQTLQMAMVE